MVRLLTVLIGGMYAEGLAVVSFPDNGAEWQMKTFANAAKFADSDKWLAR